MKTKHIIVNIRSFLVSFLFYNSHCVCVRMSMCVCVCACEFDVRAFLYFKYNFCGPCNRVHECVCVCRKVNLHFQILIESLSSRFQTPLTNIWKFSKKMHRL